jgi:hypothetical protein
MLKASSIRGKMKLCLAENEEGGQVIVPRLFVFLVTCVWSFYISIVISIWCFLTWTQVGDRGACHLAKDGIFSGGDKLHL